jgi:hypothetical protein
MSRLFLGLWLGLVGLGAVPAAAENEPTHEDVQHLAEHVRLYPPSTYDIEVIVEFRMKKSSEESIRRSVEKIYKWTDETAPPSETPEERARQIEREVRHILEEQEHPRRIRQRWLYSREQGYRLEQVIECLNPDRASFSGPVEDAPFQEIYVYPGDSRDPRSVFLNPRQKIASFYAQPGMRGVNPHVWRGGALDWPTLILLKLQLRIGQPDEAEKLDALRTGRHPMLQLDVMRDVLLPDGSPGRRFVLHVRSGWQSAETRFDVPIDSFNPVWNLVYPHGAVMEVLSAQNGVATEWIDRGEGAPEGGRRYKVISRRINVPLDPELFAFKAPEGWASVDHTVNPPKSTYPDGRVEYGKKRDEPPPPKPQRPPEVRWALVVAGQLCVVSGVLLAFYFSRRKRTAAASSGAKPQ